MPTYHAKLTTGKWLDPYTRNALQIRIEWAIRSVLDDPLESVHAYIKPDPVRE